MRLQLDIIYGHIFVHMSFVGYCFMGGSIRVVRGDWEIEDFDIKRYPLTSSIPKFLTMMSIHASFLVMEKWVQNGFPGKGRWGFTQTSYGTLQWGERDKEIMHRLHDKIKRRITTKKFGNIFPPQRKKKEKKVIVTFISWFFHPNFETIVTYPLLHV